MTTCNNISAYSGRPESRINRKHNNNIKKTIFYFFIFFESEFCRKENKPQKYSDRLGSESSQQCPCSRRITICNGKNGLDLLDYDTELQRSVLSAREMANQVRRSVFDTNL